MVSRSPIDVQADIATTYIQAQTVRRPRVGIILGTGAGVLANSIRDVEPVAYARIPGFPISTAPGHEGRLLFGQLAGHQVVAMDGRFHLYEGHTVDQATVGLRVMHRLGVGLLVITNASGGLNPVYRSGDIMAIRSHVDLMFRSAQTASVPVAQGRPATRTDRYDPELIAVAQQTARRNNFVLHAGVYGGLLGPTYETRAEYRMLRRIGVDVAGMSTVPEVVVAASLGMRILALSVVTNVAQPDVLAPTTGQQVIDAAETAAPRIHRIVCRVVTMAA